MLEILIHNMLRFL